MAEGGGDSDQKCAECGSVGPDVVVRRSKGKLLLCGPCFASSVEARVKSKVAHRFARSPRPFSQHVILVAVSGSRRSLALLLALTRGYPASLDRSFRLQPVYVRRCSSAPDPAEEEVRAACAAMEGALPLVTVDALSEELEASWKSLPEEARVPLWRVAFVAALSTVAERLEHPLCIVTAETSETLSARCLELTGSARGSGVVCFCSLVDEFMLSETSKPLAVMRLFGDLLYSEVEEYSTVRHIEGIRTESAARERGALQASCINFCNVIQKQFDHTGFTIVSTAGKLGVDREHVRCALCGVPVKPASSSAAAVPAYAAGRIIEDKVDEARRVRLMNCSTPTEAFMCFACCRMYRKIDSAVAIAAMERFAQEVTARICRRPQ